jgi:hypothetical protein
MGKILKLYASWRGSLVASLGWFAVSFWGFLHEDTTLNICIGIFWHIYFGVGAFKGWGKEQRRKERSRLMGVITAYYWQQTPIPPEVCRSLGIDLLNRPDTSEELLRLIIEEELARLDIDVEVITLPRQPTPKPGAEVDLVAIDCDFYSKQPLFLKCAVNPKGLCQNCVHYSPPPSQPQ